MRRPAVGPRSPGAATAVKKDSELSDAVKSPSTQASRSPLTLRTDSAVTAARSMCRRRRARICLRAIGLLAIHAMSRGDVRDGEPVGVAKAEKFTFAGRQGP